MNQCCHWGQSC